MPNAVHYSFRHDVEKGHGQVDGIDGLVRRLKKEVARNLALMSQYRMDYFP